MPTSPPESGNGPRETLLPKEAAPAPSKKPVCIKKPHPTVSTADAGPAGLPRGEVQDSEPGEGVGKASGGREETLARENSTRPASTEEDSSSDEVHLIHEDAPPRNKPSGGSGSASNIPSGKPPLGEKPASNVDSGHVAHGKPISGGKPALDGKPISALGNQTQASPTPASKPAPHSEEGAHKETAPHEKPESAEKPAPDKKPEPAKEAKKDGGDDDDSSEGTEEEDEEDGGEEDREPGGESDDGDSDAFDKELDYGLDRSPYNAYEYHDAWSDDGSEYPEPWLDPGLAEDTTGLGDGEPEFDVWGDRVARRGLETGWFS